MGCRGRNYVAPEKESGLGGKHSPWQWWVGLSDRHAAPVASTEPFKTLQLLERRVEGNGNYSRLASTTAYFYNPVSGERTANGESEDGKLSNSVRETVEVTAGLSKVARTSHDSQSRSWAELVHRKKVCDVEATKRFKR